MNPKRLQARLASAMAALIVGANVGMIIGYLIGGFVSQHYGWRAANGWTGSQGVASNAACG